MKANGFDNVGGLQGGFRVGLHSGLSFAEVREIELWRVVRVVSDGLLVVCCVCKKYSRLDGVLSRLGRDASGPMCKCCCDSIRCG